MLRPWENPADLTSPAPRYNGPPMPAAGTSIRVSLLGESTLEQGEVELIAAWSEESDDCIWVDILDPRGSRNGWTRFTR